MMTDKSWKPAWRYQLINFGEPIGSVSGMTQKLYIVSPMNGTKLRFLLDNRINDSEMEFRRISVTTAAGKNPVSVNGMLQVVLQPGEQLWTDPVEIKVHAGEMVEIETEFGIALRITGICQTWAARSWRSEFHDVSGTQVDCTQLLPWLGEDVHKPTAAVGISQFDIFTEKSTRTIAMFGDSITHMSYYSDALFERILQEYPGRAVIANAGIGGNRLCYDASLSPELGVHSSVFGDAGYKRAEQDLFGTMSPDTVLMLEGINDITHAFQYGQAEQIPTAEQFCAHYTEVINFVHGHGAEILIGTIMPETVFCNEVWFPESERLRKEINGWIRNQRLADGVLDFEVISMSSSGSLKDGFHLDGLHPNEAGGIEMAGIVPLEKILSGGTENE